MGNIINNKIKLIILFIFINLFLLDGCIALMVLISTIYNTNLIELKTLLAFPYLCFVNLNKLYLLPILIVFTRKNIKTEQIQYIMDKFRNSVYVQLIILFLVFITTPFVLTVINIFIQKTIDFDTISDVFLIFFKLNIKLGSYQAYIIMYLYWLIAYFFQRIIIFKQYKRQILIPLLDDIYSLLKCLSWHNIRNFIQKHKIFCILIVFLFLFFIMF